jgi:hypothetical protein
MREAAPMTEEQKRYIESCVQYGAYALSARDRTRKIFAGEQGLADVLGLVNARHVLDACFFRSGSG